MSQATMFHGNIMEIGEHNVKFMQYFMGGKWTNSLTLTNLIFYFNIV